MSDIKYFKAFIRVIKSMSSHNILTNEHGFGTWNVVEERLIEAKDKKEVKQYLLEKYPQFFQKEKVYEKETKDTAQFFYVVIFELYDYERKIVENNIPWVCDHCGHKHENEYISNPVKNERLYGDKKFCKSRDGGSYCMDEYKNCEMPDDQYYVKSDSPNYIYKITEKSTNKSYIGKTRNAPFFRWWNHLSHSSTPFGLYFRKTKLNEWTFEVLMILPSETPDSEVFSFESEYIIYFDSINNGFNSLISNKNAAVVS